MKETVRHPLIDIFNLPSCQGNCNVIIMDLKFKIVFSRSGDEGAVAHATGIDRPH